jgi:hypothetical protein
MKRLCSFLVVTISLAFALPAHADEGLAQKAKDFFAMVHTHGMPWGSPKMGQRTSVLESGAFGTAQIIAHPKVGEQEQKLVFLFIPVGDLSGMTSFVDLGPSGNISSVKLGAKVAMTEDEVKAAYADILTCMDRMGRTGEMCEKPQAFFAMFGIKKP